MVAAVEARDACPSDDALLACVDEHRVGDLADHLDTCDTCREVVAALGRGSGVEPERASDLPDAQLQPPAPNQIGRFEIAHQLGAGGMGVVYLARDPRLERQVALKVLRDDTGAGHRLIAEARAMARIDHDHLVAIYEIEEVGGRVAIVMEYLAGGTLRSWAAAPRSWREVASVMRGVARGLAAIHGAGLIHRDLKPDNVLFDTASRPRIADLGLATLQRVATSALVGTPAYLAPEQLAGSAADERSDQWSFFVCLYEALCGRRPFTGATPAALRSAMTAPAPRATRGPGALQALIERGLALDPTVRHPSMTAVADALDRLLHRRTRRTVIALALAAIAVPVLVLALATPREDPCARSRDAVTEVWNPAAASQLAAAFGRAGMTSTAVVVARGLDDYTSAWADMNVASCTATHVRHDQSDAMLDRRTRCLRERLAELAAVIAALATADRATFARAGQAVAMLPPVADCGDLAALASDHHAVSTDPIVRARLVDARLALARARAVASLGRTADAIAGVEPILATAVELADHALVAEARLVLADALSDDLQLALARQRLAETELAAEAAGDDDLRARALIAHATVVGALQQDPAAAAELLAHARAVIDRLGRRPDLDRRLLVADAAVAIARGDQRAGEHALRTALASLPEAGPEGVMRVIALRNLAGVLGEQGKQPEAAAVARQAVKLAETLLGPDHLDLAETLSQLALTLHFIGDDVEARTIAGRALAIKERVRGPDHVSLSSTIMVLAIIERDSGRTGSHAEARRLTDRAIALRRAGYGTDNPLLLTLQSERGSLAVDAGELAIARAQFAAAIPGLERAWGAGSPAVTQARESEALIAERAGDPAGCATRLAEVASAITAVDGPHGERLGPLGLAWARCLVLAGTLDRAATVIATTATLELAPETRASLDVISARVTLEAGHRERARALVTEVEARPVAADPDLSLELAALWVRLGDRTHAWRLVEQATSRAGEDLAAGERWFHAAEIALAIARAPDAIRLADRAIAVAVEARAGPDTLARDRCLAARARRVRCTP